MQKVRNAIRSIHVSIFVGGIVSYALFTYVMPDGLYNDMLFQTDQTILFSLLVTMFIVSFLCFLFQWLRSIVVSIDENIRKVSRGKELIFQENMQQVAYPTRAVRKHGYYPSSKIYRTIDMDISSLRDPSNAVHLSLLPWGIDEFKQLTDYLQGSQRKDQFNERA